MTRIEVSTGQDGMPVYTLKKSRLEKIKPIRTTAIALTAAAAIGLFAMYQHLDGQAQTPNVNIIPTPTAMPPTETPPLTPTPAPTKYPWQLLPTRIFPTQEPTRMPVPTPPATSTPQPAPQPIEVPPNTPEPKPTLAPIPQPNSMSSEASISELRVGEPINFKRCFVNSFEDPKTRYIDLTSTGLQRPEGTYPGNEDNIKTEIKVPLTQEEILKKRKKDPNNKETTKIVKEKERFDVDPGTTCIDFETSTRAGALRDYYRTYTAEYKTPGRSSNTNLIYSTTLLEYFRTAWVLEGKIDDKSYTYDPVTNILSFVVPVENPAKKTQKATLKLIKPCSFLEFAEQQVVNRNTKSTILPDKPQIIPPNTTVIYEWKIEYPYRKQPNPPYFCTSEINPIPE